MTAQRARSRRRSRKQEHEEHERLRLGRATRDPAITFLLLLPLAVIHLTGRSRERAGAFSIAEWLLDWFGPAAAWVLAGALLLLLFWAIGRILSEELPWRGAAVLLVGEGILWGIVLGPVLQVLTALIAVERGPLALEPQGTGSVYGLLAVSAGAGLYEEVLFRAGLMASLYVIVASFFAGAGWRESAPTIAYGVALILSAAAFAGAHAWTDPLALEPDVLVFRFLAGLLLGVLFSWRGLAVVAYAHATYDAVLLI